MFEVGDRIIRKSNQQNGFVKSVEKRRVFMVEVHWDTGIDQWLPAEEFREWDKSDIPPPVRLSTIGRTTPEYLVDLRRKNPIKPNPAKAKKLAAQRLADDLSLLSDRKKNRSRNKAQKLISKFERGMYPQNMSQSLRNPQQQAEHEKMEMRRNYRRGRRSRSKKIKPSRVVRGASRVTGKLP